MSHKDWMLPLAAIAGEPQLVDKLKGYTANGIAYKVPRWLRPVDIPGDSQR